MLRRLTLLIYFLIVNLLITAVNNDLDIHFFNSDVVTRISSVNALREELTSYETPKVKAVYYYSHSCPHCKTNSPVFKMIAQSFHCTPDIKFFAFDCMDSESNSINTESPLNACKKERVVKFPQIKVYIPPQYVMSSNTVYKELKNTVFDQKLYTALSLQSLNYGHVISFILENTKLMYESCSDSRLIKDDFYAAIKDSTSIQQLYTFVNAICPIYLENRWFNLKLHQQYYHLKDTVLFIQYVLQHWVPASYSVEKFKVLEKFLYISMALLPDEAQVYNLDLIHDYLKDVNSGETQWNRNKFSELLKIVVVDGNPILGNIIHGKDFILASSAASGFWTYMHVMTISYYKFHLKNSNSSTPKSSTKKIVTHNRMSDEIRRSILNEETDPSSLAYLFKDMVQQFFTCSDCRDHFLFAWEHCAADRCKLLDEMVYKSNVHDDQNDPIDHYEGLVIWLWRFHSIVSYRTSVEQTVNQIMSVANSAPRKKMTDDSCKIILYSEVKTQFPTEYLCPECRKENSIMDEKHDLELIKRAVSLEIASNISEDTKRSYELEDLKLYDQVQNFKFRQITKFLSEYYWKDSWTI